MAEKAKFSQDAGYAKYPLPQDGNQIYFLTRYSADIPSPAELARMMSRMFADFFDF
jgi:hypothetical protein